MAHIDDYKIEEDKLSQEQLAAVAQLAKCKNSEACVRHIMRIIDGQATCDEIKQFEDFINDCNGCSMEYNNLKTIRDIISTSSKKHHCPQSLQEEITKRIVGL